MTEGDYFDGWKFLSMPEVCDINPARPRNLTNSDETLTSFVPMAAVDDQKGIIVDLQTRPFGEIKHGYTYFEENDVLFAKITPCMENGKSAIARGLINGFGFGSTEFHVLRPHRGILPEWIYYFVRREPFRQEAKTNFRGAVGQQRVPQEFLRNYSIPIPYPDDSDRSLAVQSRVISRIGNIYHELAEASRLHEKIIADTNRLMDAVLKEVFGDLTSKYPTKDLSDDMICLVIPGQHVMAENYSKNPGSGLPYITGPEDFQDIYPIISKWTEERKVLAHPGDVLFTVKGSGVGKVNLMIDTDCVIGRQVMAIRPNHDVLLDEYLFYALLGRYQEFQSMKQGAAIPGIRKEHVKAIKLPLPSTDIQASTIARLSDYKKAIQQMVEDQARTKVLLNQMEQSILAQAFRGEL